MRLHEQIRRDDLPRHEARFKEHMNEKVIHEIGLLNGDFQSERTEIVSKIDSAEPVASATGISTGNLHAAGAAGGARPRDHGVPQCLRECLAGTFEGTLEADEARYLRIEKFSGAPEGGNPLVREGD